MSLLYKFIFLFAVSRSSFTNAQCSHGNVRLIGGRSILEGRVEVCTTGIWGTVCDDDWDIQDATIVCNQLGFKEAYSSPCAAYFGKGTGPIFLDNVRCTGNESSLLNCSHNGISIHNCLHSEDASAVCSAMGCRQGDVRLSNGSSKLEGRVEVCNSGQWGTVCDDDFDTADARVVCQQLGYNGSITVVRRCCSDYSFGQGKGSIVLDNLSCNGTELSLFECGHAGVNNSNCDHFEDVGVLCSISERCSEGIRLVGGDRSIEGRVEVCGNGEWGTVCDDNWDSNDGDVVCAQLGFGPVRDVLYDAAYGQGSGPILVDEIDCTGEESSLLDCPLNTIHNCIHCEDASVICLAKCSNLDNPSSGMVLLTGIVEGSQAIYNCSMGFNLIGNQTRTCQFDGQWSGSISICEAVDCGKPPKPRSGEVIIDGTNYMSLATYSCDSSFLITGETTRVCQKNGCWSGEEPVCIADCGILAAPENSEIVFNSTLVGSVAVHTCEPGFVFSAGNLQRTCLNTGLWSGTAPLCAAPDPCICSPCDTFAKCTRISLSSMQFECVCEPGYIGSGFECTDTTGIRRDIAISVSSVVVLLLVILLVGAIYGYIKAIRLLIKNKQSMPDCDKK